MQVNLFILNYITLIMRTPLNWGLHKFKNSLYSKTSWGNLMGLQQLVEKLPFSQQQWHLRIILL